MSSPEAQPAPTQDQNPTDMPFGYDPSAQLEAQPDTVVDPAMAHDMAVAELPHREAASLNAKLAAATEAVDQGNGNLEDHLSPEEIAVGKAAVKANNEHFDTMPEKAPHLVGTGFQGERINDDKDAVDHFHTQERVSNRRADFWADRARTEYLADQAKSADAASAEQAA